MYRGLMRTTLDIDDAVLDAARAIAATEQRTLGAVISELARRSLRPAPRSRDGFPTFAVDADSEPLTSAMVDRALEE